MLLIHNTIKALFEFVKGFFHNPTTCIFQWEKLVLFSSTPNAYSVKKR